MLTENFSLLKRFWLIFLYLGSHSTACSYVASPQCYNVAILWCGFLVSLAGCE